MDQRIDVRTVEGEPSNNRPERWPMARITDEDLMIAADWLNVNEGEDGESEACQRVAAMLEKMIKQRHNEAAVRAVAKQHGVSARVARKAVRRAQLSESH